MKILHLEDIVRSLAKFCQTKNNKIKNVWHAFYELPMQRKNQKVPIYFEKMFNGELKPPDPKHMSGY